MGIRRQLGEIPPLEVIQVPCNGTTRLPMVTTPDQITIRSLSPSKIVRERAISILEWRPIRVSHHNGVVRQVKMASMCHLRQLIHLRNKQFDVPKTANPTWNLVVVHPASAACRRRVLSIVWLTVAIAMAWMQGIP